MSDSENSESTDSHPTKNKKGDEPGPVFTEKPHKSIMYKIKALQKTVPIHQYVIDAGFKSLVTIGKTQIKKAGVAVSEHYLVISKKQFIGGYQSIQNIHLFDIEEIHVIKDNEIFIFCNNQKITFITQFGIEFARLLVRNIDLITQNWPERMKYVKEGRKQKDFPPFKLLLSPTQIFQFCYNGYCGYFQKEYFHSVTQFYHKYVQNSSVFVDLSNLPLSEVDASFGGAMSFEPVFSALLFSPLIFGFVLNNSCRPDLLGSISKYVQKSKSLKVLSFTNCRIDGGVRELANSIAQNPDFSVLYYDFSYNARLDLDPLCIAFSKLPRPVLYIDFSYCNLSKVATIHLMKSFAANNNFQTLRKLNIRTAKFSPEAAKYLGYFLTKCEDIGQFNLRFLDIGSIPSNSFIATLTALEGRTPNLEYLSIANSVAPEKISKRIIAYIESLKKLRTLDLSGINLSSGALLKAVETFEALNSYPKTLRLDKINLEPKKLFQVLKRINGNFESISIMQNGLSEEQLSDTIGCFSGLEKLRELRIGGNLKKSAKFGKVFQKLSDIRGLRRLHVVGHGQRVLGPEGVRALVKELGNMDDLEALTVTNNAGGDKGVAILADYAESNRALRELDVNGNKPGEMETLVQLLSVVSKHPSLVVFPLPCDDIYALSAAVVSKKQHLLIEQLTNQQILAEDHIAENRAKAGMRTQIGESLMELGEMEDALVLANYKVVSRFDDRSHNMIAEHFGLPLPFAAPDEEPEGEHIETKARNLEDYFALDAGTLMRECGDAPKYPREFVAWARRNPNSPECPPELAERFRALAASKNNAGQEQSSSSSSESSEEEEEERRHHRHRRKKHEKALPGVPPRPSEPNEPEEPNEPNEPDESNESSESPVARPEPESETESDSESPMAPSEAQPMPPPMVTELPPPMVTEMPPMPPMMGGIPGMPMMPPPPPSQAPQIGSQQMGIPGFPMPPVGAPAEPYFPPPPVQEAVAADDNREYSSSSSSSSSSSVRRPQRTIPSGSSDSESGSEMSSSIKRPPRRVSNSSSDSDTGSMHIDLSEYSSEGSSPIDV